MVDDSHDPANGPIAHIGQVADRVALLERRIFLRIVEAELIRPDRGYKIGARIDDLGKQHIRPQFLLRSDGYQSYCLSHTVLINMRLPACGCEGGDHPGKTAASPVMR